MHSLFIIYVTFGPNLLPIIMNAKRLAILLDHHFLKSDFPSYEQLWYHIISHMTYEYAMKKIFDNKTLTSTLNQNF
jgi:hypothetical protein